MQKKHGALPVQMIRDLIDVGRITKAIPKNARPASLDLTLSDSIYRVDTSFLPRSNKPISNTLGDLGARKHDLRFPLECGVWYLARINELFDLQFDVFGECNPKSSTGRNNVRVKVLADGVERYDFLPHGFAGCLWALISPMSYPIVVHAGCSLTQLRLSNGAYRLDDFELRLALEKDKLLWTQGGCPIQYGGSNPTDNDGALIVTVNLSAKCAGWECIDPNCVLDFSLLDCYNPGCFFRPLEVSNGFAVLKRGRFYILTTREAVRVPPHLACTMEPVDRRSGNFSAHEAGFIDPGWGWGKEGEGKGRPLTLEVTPFEDVWLRNDQPVAKLLFERMYTEPDVVYDSTDSNYITQSGPRLSKHFAGQ